MQTLVDGVTKFEMKLDNKKEKAAAERLLSVDPLSRRFWDPSLIADVQTLWKGKNGKGGSNVIAKVYERRSELQVPDCAAYMFDEVVRIGDDGYVPTSKDILQARQRTSGIMERDFLINGVNFTFIDVGGQRNERRKWIHCFDDVTAVIFVTAISEFNQVLYEDENQNRMQESWRVFEEVLQMKYFKNTPLLVFFNKADVLREKLEMVQLKDHFPEYDGDNSFESASEWIKQQFLSRNKDKRTIYPHFTTALDTDHVQNVFQNCRDIILKQNLERLDL